MRGRAVSGRGILDADMHSLGRLIAQAWRWWIGELREMMPAGLDGAGRSDLPRFRFQGDRLIPEGRPGRPSGARGSRAAIVVPGDRYLVRTIERPAMGDRDLANMLALEGETFLPFPAGTTLISGKRLGAAPAPGRMSVAMAGLPVDTARAILVAADEAGVVPVRVWTQGDGPGADPLDFAPAMRAAGLMAKIRSATPMLWAGVGFLAALNVAVMVWRDAAAVDRLERTVLEQQPSVTVANAIVRRADGDRALVAGSLRRRSTHDALDGLAAVGEALPAGAWLQRYGWDGATVRLTGYKPPQTDVATALRRSGRFGAVRSMTDDGQEALPVGDPFDLTARIVPR